jgi:hypothetical protein
MAPGHPSRSLMSRNCVSKEGSALPMALDEMDKLRDFDDTYDKIEAPKLEWYKLTKADPNFKTSEEEFPRELQIEEPGHCEGHCPLEGGGIRKSLEGKNQYQLLADIRQRFR